MEAAQVAPSKRAARAPAPRGPRGRTVNARRTKTGYMTESRAGLAYQREARRAFLLSKMSKRKRIALPAQITHPALMEAAQVAPSKRAARAPAPRGPRGRTVNARRTKTGYMTESRAGLAYQGEATRASLQLLALSAQITHPALMEAAQVAPSKRAARAPAPRGPRGRTVNARRTKMGYMTESRAGLAYQREARRAFLLLHPHFQRKSQALTAGTNATDKLGHAPGVVPKDAAAGTAAC